MPCLESELKEGPKFLGEKRWNISMKSGAWHAWKGADYIVEVKSNLNIIEKSLYLMWMDLEMGRNCW